MAEVARWKGMRGSAPRRHRALRELPLPPEAGSETGGKARGTGVTTMRGADPAPLGRCPSPQRGGHFKQGRRARGESKRDEHARGRIHADPDPEVDGPS